MYTACSEVDKNILCALLIVRTHEIYSVAAHFMTIHVYKCKLDHRIGRRKRKLQRSDIFETLVGTLKKIFRPNI